MDWVPYGPDYIVPNHQFSAFCKEAYAVRADWEAQIIRCYETCRKLGGQFYQTESLAGIGPLGWNAPCIKEVRDREGWVIYRRPPPLTEPIAEGNFSQRFRRCSRPGCREAHPRGLVYCFRCHRVLDGEVKHNFTISRATAVTILKFLKFTKT